MSLTDAFAIDYESFYSKDYSLKTMSTYAYIYDDRFDAYLLAVRGPGIRWVGPPKDFDWMRLSGKTLLAHNCSFDMMVMQRHQRDGVIPKEFVFGPVHDTADLAAFLRVPRNLDGASKHLLGRGLDKAMREMAKGKTGAELLASLDKDRLLAYGIGDADATWEIWDKYGHLWPEPERQMSRLNREAAWYGVNVNVDKLDADIKTLQEQLYAAEESIPWKDDSPILSPKALRLEARKNGMWVPASLAKTSPDFERWLKEYGDKYPWVKAAGDWRRINTLLQKFKNLRSGLRPDGAFVYQIKYHGAATGRMSGGGDSGGKFNLQNMPRDEMFDVDLRGCFTARPGHTLLTIDKSQVEARVLLWRVRDTKALSLLAKGALPATASHTEMKWKPIDWYPGAVKFTATGMDMYEVHARATMGYTLPITLAEAADRDPAFKTMRQFSKARVLGLGFGCGKDKFAVVAKTMARLDLTPEECAATVADFRAKNPGITQLWRDHQYVLSLSADRRDPVHEVELPSGRVLSYFKPVRTAPAVPGGMGGFKASFVRGETPRHLYGSMICENEIQAIARDLLRDGWIALSRAGFRVLFTVHDEYVIEVPIEIAREEAARARATILTASKWARGCPIDVGIVICPTYIKD